MKNIVYYLDTPGGTFTPTIEEIGEPGYGEIRLRTLRTSVCQSDVVIYNQGLSRIKQWPAILLHEASCEVDAVGEGVKRFKKEILLVLVVISHVETLPVYIVGRKELEIGQVAQTHRLQDMSFLDSLGNMLFYPVGL